MKRHKGLSEKLLWIALVLVLLAAVPLSTPLAVTSQSRQALASGNSADSAEAEWNRTFGGTRQDRAYSVGQTDDGGYIVAGWTDSYGAGDRDVHLVKTDAEGKEQWSMTFGGSDVDVAF